MDIIQHIKEKNNPSTENFPNLPSNFSTTSALPKHKKPPTHAFLHCVGGKSRQNYFVSTAMVTSFWLRLRKAVISSASSGAALMRARS